MTVQLDIFREPVPADRPEILPGSMLDAKLWAGPHSDLSCSWCGARDGHDSSRDAEWSLGYELISWGGEITPERICPHCPIAPTDIRRAVEVAWSAVL